MTDQQQHEPFDQWAIVEVLGHNQYSGRVTEQTVGGAAMIRVDVPAMTYDVGWDGEKNFYQPAFTKLLSAASIYAITPCSEEVAREAAQKFRATPMNVISFEQAVMRRLDKASDT